LPLLLWFVIPQDLLFSVAVAVASEIERGFSRGLKHPRKAVTALPKRLISPLFVLQFHQEAAASNFGIKLHERCGYIF
jgi:hypothetical protein